MAGELVCWRCGASLRGVPLPLSRRAQCPACEAELHVCRLCQFYNPRVSDRCDEPRAEHPRDSERANFCDYFKPRPAAYRAPDSARVTASKSKLDALFGRAGEAGKGEPEGQAGGDATRHKLDELFGRDDKKRD